jgi:acetoin utilization deacetylase AcuC-like enzyme
MGLTSGDYADVLVDVLQLAPPGRVIAFLEGGYDLDALVSCSSATIGALLGERRHDEPPTSGGPGADTVVRLTELHRRMG